MYHSRLAAYLYVRIPSRPVTKRDVEDPKVLSKIYIK